MSVEVADTLSVTESISGKQGWLTEAIKRQLDEKNALSVGSDKKLRAGQLSRYMASIYGILLAPFHAVLPESS
jgi:hypothetical protein